MPSKLDPYIHLLGTIPDVDIARMAKCTNELVRQQRNKRGITLFVDGRKRLGDRTRLSIAKQTEITRLGGKITDSEIAERLDISTATVRKYRRSSGIARGGFYGAIRALCEQCGGLFVLAPREGRGTTFKAANRALLKMMREAHEALEACFAAMADGVITETEQRRCLAELDQMIAAADAARQRIQEMPVQREIAHA